MWKWLLFLFFLRQQVLNAGIRNDDDANYHYIGLHGHAGLGNQLYRYVSLSAIISSAKRLGLIDSQWRCEFSFSDSGVGPVKSDTNRYKDLGERLTFPKEGCAVHTCLRTNRDSCRSASQVYNSWPSTLPNISISSLQGMILLGRNVGESTDKSQNIRVLLPSKVCYYMSKGFCYMRGIDRTIFWEEVSKIASAIQLNFRGSYGTSNYKIISKLNGLQPPIDDSTLCIHVRGKMTEHRGPKWVSRDVFLSFDSALKFLLSNLDSKRFTMIRFISLLDISSVLEKVFKSLKPSEFSQLAALNIPLVHNNRIITPNGQHTLIQAKKSSEKMSVTENVFLDLLTMNKCSFLVLEEALGRGTFSGSSVLWSRKMYCLGRYETPHNSSHRIMCSNKTYNDGITTLTPWSMATEAFLV